MTRAAHAKTGILVLLLFAAAEASGVSTLVGLSHSDAPRDWVLAAGVMRTQDMLDDSEALTRKALEAAPGDVLVQWIGTLATSRGDQVTSLAVALERARRLAALEPDNAAHYLLLLTLQDRAKDAAGIDETLAKMAAAKRFDEHYRDYLLAWADAWRRFPPAGWEFGMEVMMRRATAPYPPYAMPLDACDPTGQDAVLAASRGKPCEAVARRMLEGRTLEAPEIGYEILRRMKRMTPADETAARALKWVRARIDEAITLDAMRDPAFGPQLLDDWRDIGVEMPILVRHLEKAGIPAAPPPGWSPAVRGKNAPLVEIRLADAAPDAARRAKSEADLPARIARQRKAYANLKASASPRDWAIASQLRAYEEDVGPDGVPAYDKEKAAAREADRIALLHKAAAAAPSDPLVQWLALKYMPRMDINAPPCEPPPERVAAVEKLEPDNGLAWLPALDAAATARNDAEIDRTLARMVAAKRYDNHRVDYTHALLDLARREPDIFLAHASSITGTTDPAEAASTAAWLDGHAMYTSEYDVGDVCDAKKRSNANARRFAVCAGLGRRLSREGATSDLRKVGFKLLHQSGRLDAQDAAAERDFVWLTYKGEGLQYGYDGLAAGPVALEAKTLWLAHPDDLAVFRTQLERRGLRLTAPPGWRSPNEPPDDAEP